MEISVNLFASESAAKRPVCTKTLVTAFGSKSTYSSALSWHSKIATITRALDKASLSGPKKTLAKKLAQAKRMRGLYMKDLGLSGFIPATATTIQRVRTGSDLYPVGKKVRLEIQKAPSAVRPKTNPSKAPAVSGPELLNSILKKHTLYQVNDNAIIKAVNVGGGRQAAQLLCDITSITKTSATVNSPVFGTLKFALTPAGVKKLMDAVSKATGGRYGAFKSESASVKFAELEFGAAIDMSDIAESIADTNASASTKVKLVSKHEGVNGFYMAIVSGTKADLVKFLTVFYDGAEMDEDDIVELIADSKSDL